VLSVRYGEYICKDKPKTTAVITQIIDYLKGERKHFDYPIDWSGMTPFQRKTLRAVNTIPYGATMSYSQIAAQIGAPRAQRAVGRANATNPIPIVIPCHRVIGADGNLRGYGSGDGIKTKVWLLELEKKAHSLKPHRW
jgi:O-6-methylguanine DNA methyltransferase